VRGEDFRKRPPIETPRPSVSFGRTKRKEVLTAPERVHTLAALNYKFKTKSLRNCYDASLAKRRTTDLLDRRYVVLMVCT